MVEELNKEVVENEGENIELSQKINELNVEFRDYMDKMKVIYKQMVDVQKKVQKLEKKKKVRNVSSSDKVKSRSTSFQNKYTISSKMCDFINSEPEILNSIVNTNSVTTEEGIARGEFSKFLSLYNKKYNLNGKKEDGSITGAIILDFTDKNGPAKTAAGKKLFNMLIFPRDENNNKVIPDQIIWKNVQKYISGHYGSMVLTTNESGSKTSSKISTKERIRSKSSKSSGVDV